MKTEKTYKGKFIMKKILGLLCLSIFLSSCHKIEQFTNPLAQSKEDIKTKKKKPLQAIKKRAKKNWVTQSIEETIQSYQTCKEKIINCSKTETKPESCTWEKWLKEEFSDTRLWYKKKQEKENITPYCSRLKNKKEQDSCVLYSLTCKNPKVKKIISKAYSSCALRVDGSVLCWGDNKLTSLKSYKENEPFLAISSGFNHICGIKSNKKGFCWGSKTLSKYNIPENFGTIEDLSLSAEHTCVINRNSLKAKCWGDNEYGQTSIPNDLGQVKKISTGIFHNCALKADKTVRCWGWDYFGQTDIPVDVEGVKELHSTSAYNCVIKENNQVQCWGDNRDGQCDVPEDLGEVNEIALGGKHTCAITKNDALVCWGKKDRYEALVDKKLYVKSVSAGFDHTCVITDEENLVQCSGTEEKHTTAVPSEFKKD